MESTKTLTFTMGEVAKWQDGYVITKLTPVGIVKATPYQLYHDKFQAKCANIANIIINHMVSHDRPRHN